MITKAINGEITIGSYSPIRSRIGHPHKEGLHGAFVAESVITSQDVGKKREAPVNSVTEVGHQSHDPAVQVPLPPPVKTSPAIPRRDEKLRELMRAIETYDR